MAYDWSCAKPESRVWWQSISSYLHSLDSLKLAERLDRLAGRRGRKLPVLLEMNVSGEESKFGLAAGDEQAWPDLAAYPRSCWSCHIWNCVG